MQEYQEEERLETLDGKTVKDRATEEEINETIKVRFHKLQYFINYVREVSFNLIFVLGTLLSLNEMMIRFCDRSTGTH